MNTVVPMVKDPLAKAREELIAELVRASEVSEEFRALLLSDPREAISQVVGGDPLPSYTYRVVEEKPGEIVIVLPAAVDTSELPDQLLDLASGGTSFSAFILYGPPYPDRKPKR